MNFYLGIDVSKGYADFVFLNQNKKIVSEPFQLDDTSSGHKKLYEILKDFQEQHKASAIFAGLESTGGYENNWLNSLKNFEKKKELQIKTAKLNPYGVRSNSRAGLERNITDKISALNIAEYLISHPEKCNFQTEGYFNHLRKQWNFIKLITKQKTALLNHLQSLLYVANPEILPFCKDSIPQWVLKLLLRYPTAKKLSRAKVETLLKIPYIKNVRAIQLIERSKNSIASFSEDTEEMIKILVQNIMNSGKIIKSMLKKIMEQCPPEIINLLKSCNGIGDYCAVGLYVHIQNIHNFSNAKKLSSFFGIHPVYKKSGDGSWGFHMSKKGCKEVRHILFLASVSAIRVNPIIANLYQECLKKGMKKKVALGICMHKLLRIVFGMLSKNKQFDPEIDKRNQEQSISNKQKEKEKKEISVSRRFLEFSENAPISKRQDKKRKQWMEP